MDSCVKRFVQTHLFKQRTAFAESKTMETFHPDMTTYVKSCTRTRPRESKWCRVISWSVVVVSRSLWSVVISRAKWETGMMTAWKCSGKGDRQLPWWKIWHWFKQKKLDSPSAECARGAGADAFYAGKSLWKRFSASCSAGIREVELATETRKITRELRWIVTKWIFLNRSHDVTVRNKRRKVNVLFHRSANIVGPWKPLWHFYCIYRIIHW